MVVWMPRWAHAERDPKIPVVRDRDETVMVSQFMMELQGLNVVDKEELVSDVLMLFKHDLILLSSFVC